jgi:polyhydroxyalkanoate synthesis repressor PhaR
MIMAVRLIKKYPNRRLYDTQASAYITLSDVKKMIVQSLPVKVLDAKTEEDLTRSILLQIILEEEAGGQPIFSEAMLLQMVRFYGHSMQSMMGSYLEKTMQVFVEMQDRFVDPTRDAATGMASAPFAGANANALPNGFPPPEQWGQFLSMQAPMMQGFMSNYMEQSKNMFVQMQEQMTQQTASLWPGFPFPAGSQPSAASAAAKAATEAAEKSADAGKSSSNKPVGKSAARKSAAKKTKPSP